jgi:hypothetical protein
VALWADGHRLKYDAPRGVITPEVREALSRHKDALLQKLGGSQLVSLKGGLTVPRSALECALALEARGIVLTTDDDGELVVPDDGRLTRTDRLRLERWRSHVAALLRYETPTLS